LKANLRDGKGGTFMVGPGRHLASLRPCLKLLWSSLCGPLAKKGWSPWIKLSTRAHWPP